MYENNKFNVLNTESIMTNVRNINNKKLRDLINNILLKNYQDDMWVQMLLHGDLNYHNVLASNNKFYIIDWEFTRELTFYHDIINIMFIEAASFNNYLLLNEFLLGQYDEEFNNLFNSVGMQYLSDKKNYFIF